MLRFAGLIALLLAIRSEVATAQFGEMQELFDLNIVVEHLNRAAAKCNVRSDGIDAALRLPIDDSRLKVRESSSDGSYLYANANVMHLETGLCVASIELSLHRRVVLMGSDTDLTGASVLSKSAVMTGPPHDFGQRVNSSLREFTELFLAEWIKQNPKPEPAS